MQRKELEIIRAGRSHKRWLSARLLLGMTDEQATALHKSIAMERHLKGGRLVKGNRMFETAVIAENYDDLLHILFSAASVALIARTANEAGNSLKKMGIPARQMSEAMETASLVLGVEAVKRIAGLVDG